MEERKPPLIVERFADNGEHSHWELICRDTQHVLWVQPEIELPCNDCQFGEYIQHGFHKPDGTIDYECNICKHRVSFP